MKKLLLTTALSFVLVGPAMAENPEIKVIEPSLSEQSVTDEALEKVADEMHAKSEVQVEEIAEKVSHGMSVKTDVIEEDVVVEEDGHGAEEKPAHAHWGYVGADAAPYWGVLDEAYHACAKGAAQSPINIATFLQEDLSEIVPSYKDSGLSVVNNGHTIQVNYEDGSGFRADNVDYKLLQLHFHTPSEHYLDGAPYPMEVHFVHKTDDGVLGVIGVMMKVGEHNPVIEGIWQNAPINAGGTKTVESVKISARALMPESLEYYKYGGSLTTPPCSEGVRWHVMKDPIEVSEKQLKAFQALFPVNARPVQPLNDRVITGD